MSLWANTFGNDYTERNLKGDVQGRAEIWRIMLPRQIESILEVGANVGHNLEAIASFRNLSMYACEPNDTARQILLESDLMPHSHLTADYADKLSFDNQSVDLAFTCGVLIHIPPPKLIESMKEIHRVSQQYILCAEYFAPSEEMVPYRGKNDELWRRDYGSLWLDNFPDLHCIGSMFAWKRQTAFDNLTFWLFEKGSSRH